MILSVKKVVAMSIVVSLLGVVGTFGLKTLTSKEATGPVEAETTYGPVKLTMTLDKTVYRVGEPINITVTLINIGNKAVWLGRSSPPVLDYIVYNESLQPIYAYSSSGVFAGVVVSYRIEPGESLSKTSAWDQLEIDSFPPFESRQVLLGSYFIAGRTAPGASVFSSTEEPLITLETPKIEIRIF